MLASPAFELRAPEDEELIDEWAVEAGHELDDGFPAITADGQRILVLEAGSEHAPSLDVVVLEASPTESRSGETARELERAHIFDSSEVWGAEERGDPARTLWDVATQRLRELAARVDPSSLRTFAPLDVLEAQSRSPRLVICSATGDRVVWEQSLPIQDDDEDCEGMTLDAVRGFVDRTSQLVLVRAHISGSYEVCPELRWFITRPITRPSAEVSPRGR